MKTLVVYDSVHGNTGSIAKAIGEAITGEVEVLPVGEVNTSQLTAFDLLIVGSPTYGGRPTEAMRDFLDKVRESGLKGTNVAAFDTRLTARWVRIIGFAAGRIAGRLKKDGGTLVVSPEGFFVEGTEGPLKEGELERAAAWAKKIVESIE
ncbi:MAG: flavodoxin [Anaerolineae bacterium]|nr:flavodoxin [Anaerolineae bacterium]NIN96448.1 flavodoxin [Anaerolineae bacterium]NIQ81033.1 flavodoxin [Anaerolineae bacterium]